MQDQLESMMSRAEELAVAALDSTQEPFAKRQRWVWAQAAVGLRPFFRKKVKTTPLLPFHNGGLKEVREGRLGAS